MEYLVYFKLKINAKDKKELNTLAERIGEKMSLCAGKTVHPHSYQILEEFL